MSEEQKKEIEELEARIKRLEDIVDVQSDILLYTSKQLANHEFFVKLTRISKN